MRDAVRQPVLRDLDHRRALVERRRRSRAGGGSGTRCRTRRRACAPARGRARAPRDPRTSSPQPGRDRAACSPAPVVPVVVLGGPALVVGGRGGIAGECHAGHPTERPVATRPAVLQPLRSSRADTMMSERGRPHRRSRRHGRAAASVPDGAWPFGLPKEEELAAAIDALPMAAWLYTADGRPVAISSRWTKLTGQTIDEWREHGWAAIVHPDDRERVTCGWNEFAGTEIRTGAARVPHRPRRDGRTPPRRRPGRSHRLRRVRLLRRLHRGRHCAGGGAERGAATGRRSRMPCSGWPSSSPRVPTSPPSPTSSRARWRSCSASTPPPRAVRGRRRRAGRRAVVGGADGRPRRRARSSTSPGRTPPRPSTRTGVAARMRRPDGPGVLLPDLVERVAVPVHVGGRLWGALSINSADPRGIDRPRPSSGSRSLPTWSRSRSPRPRPGRRCSAASCSRRP